jgi:hypothetical protein
MTRTRAISSLVVGLLATMSACAAKDNPVLPPSGMSHPVGQVAGVSALDAGDAARDFGDTLDSAANTDASTSACDLLRQDCARLSDGCYPSVASGGGRCMTAGATGALGTCVLGEDPQACAAGLVCIALTAGITLGQCLYLCDVSNSAFTCGAGSLCQPLPSLPRTTGVGYCQPPG